MYDLTRKTARVEKILSSRPGVNIVSLSIEGEEKSRAINYKKLTGIVKTGDTVLVNTTAVELGLGTGGYHFIISNLDNTAKNKKKKDTKSFKSGHIMKMRYTPYQVKTLSVEEKDSPYHEQIKQFSNLKGQPVVLIPLHSLLAPLAIVFKHYFPAQKLVYIMTEGGALPLELSKLVYDLREKGFIDKTITIGHAFGGDLEAVNIFTGLAAASEIANGDLIVVGMGPGITGTGTQFGFSGVENVFYNYAVNILRGKSLIVPRISFAETRKRHHIISHHTITLFEKLIKESTDIVFPADSRIMKRLQQMKLFDKHNIIFYHFHKIEEILRKSNYNFCSMGRSFIDDPLFFVTGGLPVLRYKELLKE